MQITDFKTKNMMDLSQTIAADLFRDAEYPWEVLGKISEFIIALGETLPADRFEEEILLPSLSSQKKTAADESADDR